MLDIKIRRVSGKIVYHTVRMQVYGAEFDFGLLDPDETKALAETLREAADELDPQEE